MDNLQNHKIQILKIHDKLDNLPKEGKLCISSNGLLHLKIDDGYIHNSIPIIRKLYPFLSTPSYFDDEKVIGAHISVIYPNEFTHDMDPIKEVDLTYAFVLKSLFLKTIASKIYCGFIVQSQELENLRKQYRLPKLLNFKGINVEFHITMATSQTQ